MKSIDELNLIDTFLLLLIKEVATKAKGQEITFPYNEFELYQRIAEYYYLITKEKVDISYALQKEKLYKWAKNQTRYPILNNLILDQIRQFIDPIDIDGITIDNRDLFMLTNLNTILTKVYDELKDMIINTSDISINLSTITKEKTVLIIRNILLEIDPSGEWLSIYDNAIKNKKIIYLNELSEEEQAILKIKCGTDNLINIDDTCIILPENDIYLILNYEGNIADVSKTIHEIIHYIIKYKHGKDNEIRCLKEFPSIFYELYALNYLSKIWYDELELKTINNTRLNNTLDCITSTALLRHYIEIYNNYLEITEDIDRRKYLKKLTDFFNTVDEKTIIDLKENIPELFNADKTIHEMCDSVTEDLLQNPCYLFTTYPYVIGNYLAIHAINLSEYDSTILTKMKNYVENITKIDPYEIFHDLGINLNITKTEYELANQYKKLIKSKTNRGNFM